MIRLRHGAAREVQTGFSLLSPEKHWRRFLLFALALLPTVAGAHGPGRPDLFTTTAVSIKCDMRELLDASRQWARIMGPGQWVSTDIPGVTPGPVRHMRWDFSEVGTNTMERAEQRWRQAVEACTR